MSSQVYPGISQYAIAAWDLVTSTIKSLTRSQSFMRSLDLYPSPPRLPSSNAHRDIARYSELSYNSPLTPPPKPVPYAPPRLRASNSVRASKAPTPVASDARQPLSSNRQPLAPTQPRAPKLDNFRTMFHPSSGLPPKIKPFETYGIRPAYSAPVDDQPWLPFHSDCEFKFAEILLASALSNKHIDELIAVVHSLRDPQITFEVKSHEDIDNLWTSAAGLHGLAAFAPEKVLVDYLGTLRDFDFWHRPFELWLKTSLEDVFLASVCNWNAIKTDKFDGKDWVPFVTEPYTAKRIWDFQLTLPRASPGSPPGVPIAITLYADKTRLSSFGSVQGYPIMANITNFPDTIQNGHGLGATQVIGWLPIVAEEENEQGKTEWINFKKAVWHECFRTLLKDVARASRTVMALTRGVQSNFPCPICAESQALVEQCMKMRPIAAEVLLVKEGLRPVKNVFWDIAFSGPHEAIGFDELHVNDGGIGGRHLWPMVVAFLDKLGSLSVRRAARQKVDDQAKAMPRWPDFSHFDSVVSVSFTDGNKFRDLLKIVPYIAHNVLTDEASSEGYLVLCCVRAYLEAVMWENLHVHTSNTIAAARHAVERFGARMMELDELLRSDDILSKNLDFPKLHAHKHAVDHIVDKGVLRHSTTRTFEGRHQSLKKGYAKSSHKNIESQILKHENNLLVCSVVRDCIDAQVERAKREADIELQENKRDSRDATPFGNIHLGSKVTKHISFAILERDRCKDPAFHRFRSHLEVSLKDILQ
ncbi:hypothetical protein DXG01_015761 [Tephrocybe rancida]|nr:hypothetical protein DXG01_015761 [Tephrocybe rancida]